MNKSRGLLPLLGIVAVIFAIAALLFPLGPGIVVVSGDPATSEAIMGYSFVFGNDAQNVYSANGGLIAAFTLALIGGVFQLFALLFSFGSGSKKFSGFLYFVAGIAIAAAALCFFLANKVFIGDFVKGATSQKAGWGFILAGAFSAASALASIGAGVKGYSIKE